MLVPPREIPLAARLLGFAGLLPFAFGLLITLAPLPKAAGASDPLILAKIPDWVLATFMATDGPALMITYGKVILSFMSGCLWGFATRSETHYQWRNYGLSVLPALYVFFFIGGDIADQLLWLSFGFVGILYLDAAYQHWRLAPFWWFTLRVLITVVVVTLLMVARALLP